PAGAWVDCCGPPLKGSIKLINVTAVICSATIRAEPTCLLCRINLLMGVLSGCLVRWGGFLGGTIGGGRLLEPVWRLTQTPYNICGCCRVFDSLAPGELTLRAARLCRSHPCGFAVRNAITRARPAR